MHIRIANSLIAGLFMLFTLSLLMLAEYYWDYRANVITFPWIAGALVITSSILILIRSWTLSLDKLMREGESVGQSDAPRSMPLKRIGWLASVFPLCYLFGLLLGLLGYTIAYTSYHSLPWWQRLLSAGIVFAVLDIGFYQLLGVPLPVSPLWLRG